MRHPFLAFVGAGVATFALAACSSTGTSSAPVPNAPSGGAGSTSHARAVQGLSAVPGGPPLASRVVGAPNAQPGWLAPDAKKHIAKLYVGDWFQNIVAIYRAHATNPSPIGVIATGVNQPYGIYVDRAGKLYVGNGGTNTVTEYPAGHTAPSVTLALALKYGATDLIVGNDGMLYVAGFSDGQVLEYPKGSSKPSLTLTVPYPNGLALDTQNNLYVAGMDGSGAGIVKFAPGSTKGTNLGIALAGSGGLAFDAQGNLLAVNAGGQTGEIDVFAPGATQPTRTIPAGIPDFIALDRSTKHLYVSDVSNGVVDVFDYASGIQTGTVSTGIQGPIGVALSPAAPY